MKGYEKLDDVLARAFNQASQGKGKERHANDLPFHEQPMQQVNAMVGVGFSHGQAIKKIIESQNMAPEQAVHELLGAICYLAGSIITLESANDNQPMQVPSKMHEYLDQNYKLQLVDELDEMLGNPPKDWIKVPEGAVKLTKGHEQRVFWNGQGLSLNIDTGKSEFSKGDNFGSYMRTFKDTVKILWEREEPPAVAATPEQAREKARAILSNMLRGETKNVHGRMISFNHQGLFVAGYFHSDSVKETLDYLFQEKL